MPISLACQFASCSHHCPFFQGDAWLSVQKALLAYVKDSSGPLLHFNKQVSDWVLTLGDPGNRGNGQAISRIFDTFSRSAKCPPEDLLNMMIVEATSELPEMTPSNIARLSKAIGNLAFDPGDVFLAALDRRIRRIATHFRPIEARQLLHGLAMLDAVQQNFHAGERYPLGKTYKFLMVNALFSKTCRDGAEIGQMNLLADTERWFTGDSPIRYHWQSEGRKSDFERQALRTLKYVGIEIMPRVKDENVNHAPDIHGRYKGVELHVECDGPSHMIESCDGQQTYLNGQTVLQTGLLGKALQGSIVRIPIDVFSLNRTRPYFWNGLLRYIVSHKEDAVFLSGTRCPKIEPFGLIAAPRQLDVAA